MGDTVPQSPAQLLEELFAIFPEYRARYVGAIHDFEPTFHSVLMAFDPFLSRNVIAFSKKQLREFSDLIIASTKNGGDLSNAFDTVLLEHFHQTGMDKIFKPYLPKARQ